MADGRDSWFFIIGCQRSGTTLMRLILESHSQVACCDESLAYNVIRGSGDPARTRRLLGLKVPCLTEQFANPSFWDEFLLRQAIPNPYAGQKLIFMVRDVRDTVASMLELRLPGEPWNGARWYDMNLAPSLRAKIANDMPFRRRYAIELSRLRTAVNPELARAAFYWRYKTEALLDYCALGFPALLVRYEDLVAQPQVELLRVCGFLQMPWEAALLAHHRAPHRDVAEDGSTIGGTDPRRAIDLRSRERWRVSFAPADVRTILEFAGDVQSLLYPASASAVAGEGAAAGR
ncbi:MAG: sulfotransferase family protein [Vicinamibacterales bacterium]